jgi:hypothetical protein
MALFDFISMRVRYWTFSASVSVAKDFGFQFGLALGGFRFVVSVDLNTMCSFFLLTAVLIVHLIVLMSLEEVLELVVAGVPVEEALARRRACYEDPVFAAGPPPSCSSSFAIVECSSAIESHSVFS